VASRIRTLTFDCADPVRLATFWREALGYPSEIKRDEDGAWLEDPSGAQPAMNFDVVPEGKTAKNRIHFDLEPEIPRDQEVDRLRGLGATVLADFRKPDGTGWVVMTDPEGNEFCVERSRAEREQTEERSEAEERSQVDRQQAEERSRVDRQQADQRSQVERETNQPVADGSTS
jgi:hypothetical protein